MAGTVQFHHLALEELRRARGWYSERSTSAPIDFRDEIIVAIDKIAERGTALPKAFGQFRYIKVQRFPYVIVFRKRSEASFVVVAVAHTSRRFGYWRRRK